MTLERLYDFAEKENIEISNFPLNQKAIIVEIKKGEYAIAIDESKVVTNGERRVCVAHELGHYNTGTLYNVYTKFEVREKRERRADKWAIKKLVTADELHEAVSKGYTEMWQLAEHFDIPQDFMEKIVCYYEGLEW